MNIFTCCAKTSDLDRLGLSREQRNAVKKFWTTHFGKQPRVHFQNIFTLYLTTYPDYYNWFHFNDTIGSIAYDKDMDKYSSVILSSLSSLVRLSTENIEGFMTSISDIVDSHMEREVSTKPNTQI